MSHGVTERIEEQKEFFTGQTAEAEALGQLPEETTKRMKATGVIRLLQPPEHGGYAADPTDFMEAVMALGNADPAVGWVAGVIGVHPWEMAFNDQRVLQEVWGQDADTWVASPYAPNGIARQVDGGFVFNGKWEFSSGTDSCDWIVLGGNNGCAYALSSGVQIVHLDRRTRCRRVFEPLKLATLTCTRA